MFSVCFLFSREFPINPFWGHPGCEVPQMPSVTSMETMWDSPTSRPVKNLFQDMVDGKKTPPDRAL